MLTPLMLHSRHALPSSVHCHVFLVSKLAPSCNIRCRSKQEMQANKELALVQLDVEAAGWSC